MYVLSHMCFQTSSAFLVRNLSVWEISLLTIFQKLFTVSNTVIIVAAYMFIKRCYACPTVIKITFCRNEQLIWLEGHFEKAAFSG